jgi:hypothetical protein
MSAPAPTYEELQASLEATRAELAKVKKRRSEHSMAWQKANVERYKATRAAWEEKNKEHLLAVARENGRKNYAKKKAEKAAMTARLAQLEALVGNIPVVTAE